MTEEEQHLIAIQELQKRLTILEGYARGLPGSIDFVDWALALSLKDAVDQVEQSGVRLFWRRKDASKEGRTELVVNDGGEDV